MLQDNAFARLSDFEDSHAEFTAIRRHLHAHPELSHEEAETAGFVAAKLEAWGYEVTRGIGGHGVVGRLKVGNGTRSIGIRADMDALPITEETGLDYASTKPGTMHACGHDGHTTVLLAAAEYLARTRRFSGTLNLIFQPAEEGGGGGREMVKDGMMEKFAISEVYGMHNLPGLDVGRFATRPGPIMASTDEFNVVVRGRGGHAAMPHTTVDPVVIAAQIISALQTIASRNVDPLQSTVVSVTILKAGDASNVIPDEVKFAGTIRTLTPEIRDYSQKRLREISEGVASAMGGEARVTVHTGYPVTRNHGEQTGVALNAAGDVAGLSNIDPDINPMMGGEDFSYMLNARPGNFIFIGNGATAALHNADYDFNDEIIPHGVSYWVRLAETRLASLAA